MIVEKIKIDKTPPTVTIETQEWGKVTQGDIKVSGTLADTGSGVHEVQVWFNGGRINDNLVDVSPTKAFPSRTWKGINQALASQW